jgi:hypothetical protein
MSNAPIQHVAHPSIIKAIDVCGQQTVDALQEFYLASSKLENNFKQHAIALIDATLRIQQGAETKRALTELLIEIGFKKSNVSKMIEACRFTIQLELTQSDAATWVKRLPVSTQYVLASCEDQTFNQIWANESKWGETPVSMKQIEQMKAKYEGQKVSARKLLEEGNQNHQPSLSVRIQKAKKLLSDVPELLEILTRYEEGI